MKPGFPLKMYCSNLKSNTFQQHFLIIFEYIKSKRKKKITNGIWRSHNLPNYFRSKKPQKLSYENVKCYVILKNFRSFKNVFENEIGMYSLCNITSFCFNVKIMHIANYSCAISKTLYVSSKFPTSIRVEGHFKVIGLAIFAPHHIFSFFIMITCLTFLHHWSTFVFLGLAI